jgi:hypothetical protein
VRLLPKPEVIGPPDCPILLRYTIWPRSLRRWAPLGSGPGESEKPPAPVKVMLHHFLPNADDRDVHDHPRPFWTLVLRGWYDDMCACPGCDGSGRVLARFADLRWFASCWGAVPVYEVCSRCRGEGVLIRERMRPGMLRLRPANHAHRTKVGPSGCWTLVVMGPLRRRWGFWRDGLWWFWKDYEAAFGFAMRCEDLDKEYRR